MESDVSICIPQTCYAVFDCTCLRRVYSRARLAMLAAAHHEV